MNKNAAIGNGQQNHAPKNSDEKVEFLCRLSVSISMPIIYA